MPKHVRIVWLFATPDACDVAARRPRNFTSRKWVSRFTCNHTPPSTLRSWSINTSACADGDINGEKRTCHTTSTNTSIPAALGENRDNNTQQALAPCAVCNTHLKHVG